MQMKPHFAGFSCTLLTAASAKNTVVPDMSEAFSTQVLRMHNEGVKCSS